MKNKKKINYKFLSISIILFIGSIILNINTISFAKERIIQVINDTPIIIEKIEVTEPIIEETPVEENIKEEDTSNSYTKIELSIILITSIIAVITLLNLLITKLGTIPLKEALSTDKRLIYYVISLVLLCVIVPCINVIQSDKKILNGIETKTRDEKSIAIVEIDSDQEITELKKESQNDDTSVIQVSNGATYTASKLELLKVSGISTDEESSLYYGLNSAFILKDNSSAILNNSHITTKTKYSTAFFVTGSSTSTLTNVNLTTEEEYSNGLVSSDGSSINASNLNITTKQKNSISLKTLTSDSEINIEDSILITEESSSPLFHSNGKITATNNTGTSLNSNIAVVEGVGSLLITESDLNTNAISSISEFASAITMYKTTSKTSSSEYSNASLTIVDSTININEDSSVYETASIFYTTNNKVTINVTNTEFIYGSNILLKATGNSIYGDNGNNGSEVTFTITDENIKGDIIVDSQSKVRFNVNNSNYKGKINETGESQNVDVTLDKTAEWTLTGDSYVNTLTIQNGNIKKLNKYIKSNGYNIYYNADTNEWLNGQTIKLNGGGKLIPIYYNQV